MLRKAYMMLLTVILLLTIALHGVGAAIHKDEIILKNVIQDIFLGDTRCSHDWSIEFDVVAELCLGNTENSVRAVIEFNKLVQELNERKSSWGFLAWNIQEIPIPDSSFCALEAKLSYDEHEYDHFGNGIISFRIDKTSDSSFQKKKQVQIDLQPWDGINEMENFIVLAEESLNYVTKYFLNYLEKSNEDIFKDFIHDAINGKNMELIESFENIGTGISSLRITESRDYFNLAKDVIKMAVQQNDKYFSTSKMEVIINNFDKAIDLLHAALKSYKKMQFKISPIKFTGPTAPGRYTDFMSPDFLSITSTIQSKCSTGFAGESCCEAAMCGDGILAGQEYCDIVGGVSDSSTCPRCRFPSCGDAIISTEAGEDCDVAFNDLPGSTCSSSCLLEVGGTVSNPHGRTFNVAYPPTAAPGSFSIQLFESNKAGDTISVFKEDMEPFVCDKLDCETPASWQDYIIPDRWYKIRTDFIGQGMNESINTPVYTWSEPIRSSCGCSYDNSEGAPLNMRVHQVADRIQISYIQDSGCATSIQARRMLKLADGDYDSQPVLVGEKQLYSGDSTIQCGVESEGDLYEHIGHAVDSKLTLGSVHRYCLTVAGKGINKRGRGTILEHCAPDVTVMWSGRVEVKVMPDGGTSDIDFIEGANVTLFVVTDEGRQSGALGNICGTNKCAPFQECGEDGVCRVPTDENLVFRQSFISSLRNERLDLVVPGVKNETQSVYVITEKISNLGNESMKHDFYCNNDKENECTYAIISSVRHLDLEYEVAVIVDKSVFTISGRVSFPNGPQQIESFGECGVVGAEVCVLDEKNNKRQVGECVEVAKNGLYSVSVSIGAKISLKPQFISSRSNITHTIRHVDSKTQRVTDDAEFYIHQVSHHYKEIFGNAVNFVDTTEREVNMITSGGMCDWLGLGTTKVEISHVCGWKHSFSYSDATNTLSIPAMPEVKIEMINVIIEKESSNMLSEKVIDYFERRNMRVTTVDLTWNDASIGWRYRVPPKIETHWPTKSCVDTEKESKEFKIIKALQVYPLRITASEHYGDSVCSYIPDLTFEFDDDVSGVGLQSCTNCTVLFNHTSNLIDPNILENAHIILDIYPVSSHLEGDHTSPFSYTVEVPGYANPISATDHVVISGNKPISSSRSVELPKWTPLLYLRDPPGGLSYSEYNKQIRTSMTLNIQSTTEDAHGSNIDFSLGLDLDTDTCFGLGFKSCQTSSVLVDAVGKYKRMSAAGSGKDEGYIYDICVTESFITSDDPSNVGAYSDMVLIPSVFIKYSESRNLQLDEEMCSFVQTPTYTWTPDHKENSFSFRSLYDIENIDIPEIENLINAAEAAYTEAKSSGDSVTARKEAVKVASGREMLAGWKNIVSRNDELKASAVACNDPEKCLDIISDPEVFNTNILDSINPDINKHINTIIFNGGGSLFHYEKEIGNISAVSTTSTSWTDDTNYTGSRIGARLFGIGGETETLQATTITTTWESKKDSKLEEDNKVIFVLGDPDIGDKFVVAVLTDPVYNMPVFRTLAGQSRCPVEDGTTAREKIYAEVEVANGRMVDVPHDQSVLFPVTLYNESPTKETMGNYIVELLTSSNPDGLEVRLFGKPLGMYTIPGFDEDATSLTLPLIVSRGPEAYNYEDVQVKIYSPCENELDDNFSANITVETTISLAIDYAAPCAQVTFGGDIGTDRRFSVTYQSDPSKNGFMNIDIKNPEWPENKWSQKFSSKDLKMIILQYRSELIIGDSWKSALDPNNKPITLKSVDDSKSDTARVVWKAPSQEGRYEIRAVTQCLTESVSSVVVTGYVDYVAPQVFSNVAEPADGVFYPGDKISVRFNEELNCNYPYTFESFAQIADDTQTIPLQSFCNGHEVELALPLGFPYKQVMGRTIEVSVAGVSDLAGNVQSAPASWTFQIAKFDLSLAIAHVNGMKLNTNLKHISGTSTSASMQRYSKLLRNEIASSVKTTPNRVVIGNIYRGPMSTILIDFSFTAGKDRTAEALASAFYNNLLPKHSRRDVDNTFKFLDKVVLNDEPIGFRLDPTFSSVNPGGSFPSIVTFFPISNNERHTREIIVDEKEIIVDEKEISAIGTSTIVIIVSSVCVFLALLSIVLGAVVLSLSKKRNSHIVV